MTKNSINYDNFKIIVDTREQQPWHFDYYATAIHKLDTGDYSVDGIQDLLCIERKKSVSEIATNITESRFQDVLARMKSYKYSFMILEFDLDDVYKYPIGSNIPKHMWNKLKITPKFILKNLIEFQLVYNIHIIYYGNAYNASKMGLSIMKKVYELEYK